MPLAAAGGSSGGGAPCAEAIPHHAIAAIANVTALLPIPIPTSDDACKQEAYRTATAEFFGNSLVS
jgi:hypothetical protein